MKIQDFKDYLQMCEDNIDYTEGTKDFYRKHIPIIDKWFFNNGVKSLDQITIRHINKFVAEHRIECSETTINKRIGVIKRAIKILKKDTEELNKILALKKLKEVKRSYEMLTDKQLKKVIRFANSLPKVSNNLLYKTFILLLVDTGARPGEILAVEKRNINLNNREILLKKTKTKIERYVYFHETDTKEAIKEMLKIEHKSKYLLWNDSKQRPINYDDVRYIMKLIEKHTGIKNVYSYMFRHTFATRLIENGADVFAVKDLMGHEKLTTTQIYTHLSKKHIKKVYDQSHIR